MQKLNLVVASGDHRFRRDVCGQLQDQQHIRNIKPIQSRDELLRTVQTGTIHLILIDVSQPFNGQAEAILAIQRVFPLVRIIHLENTVVKTSMLTWTHQKLQTRVYEDAKVVNLEEIVLSALQSGTVIAPKPNILESLTDREEMVLRMLSLDYDSHQIGKELSLSNRTIEGYKQRIKQKIGVKGVAGMVLFAVKVGLVEVNLPKLMFLDVPKRMLKLSKTA